MKTLLSAFNHSYPSRKIVPAWCAPSLCFLLYFSFTLTTLAQNKLWDKTIGGGNLDELASIQPTQEGGYILGGSSLSGIGSDKTTTNKGEFDYWIVKLDANGEKIWDRTFGGNGYEHLATVLPTRDGGYILGGYSESGKSGDKSEANKGFQNYWIVKIDNKGKKVWDKTIGGNNQDMLAALMQTSDGGYILGGTSNSGKRGDKSDAYRGEEENYDYWIVKLKADGSKEWDKTIGGSESDELSSLQQTSDGGYILGGSSTSGISGDKSENKKSDYTDVDYWVVKLKADGSKEWDKTIGGNSDDNLTSGQQTNDGGYILGGTSQSEISGDKSQAPKGGNGDYWIVKLKADGSKEWDKTIGGSNSDKLASVQQTSDGGYVAGGYSGSDISGNKSQISKGYEDYWVVKLKADGSQEWDKTSGGSDTDVLTSLQQTSDGNYILGGWSNSGKSGDKSQAAKGGSDYWIIKLDNKGSKNQFVTIASIPVKTLGEGPFAISATATSGLPVTFRVVSGPATIKDNIVTIIGLGTVLVKAFVAGTDAYQPAEATLSFFVETPALLKTEWEKIIGGDKEDVISFVQPTPDGGYILGGTSASGISGDKSEANKGEVSNGEPTTDYWIVKLNADRTIAWDKTIGGNANDVLHVVRQTSDGGYILGGYSESGKSGDKSEANKGEADYWVVKLNANGSKAWDKTIGGNKKDELTYLQPTRDGGYILGGTSVSGISGDKSEASRDSEEAFYHGDYWVVKLNSAGTKVWDKTLGGDDEEIFVSVQQTSDGGYILGGTSFSGKTGDKSEDNRGGAWLVKLQADGTIVWDKAFNVGEVSSVQPTSDGGYVLGAGGDRTSSNNDYWIIKLKANGIKEWDKIIGGDGDDVLASVQQTNDGGYILGGTSTSSISGDRTKASGRPWIVKLHADGTKVWDETIISGALISLQQVSDGGYLFSGISAGKGSFDYWIIKLTEEQPYIAQWDTRYGGTGKDNFTSVIKTSDGGYLSGGYTNSGVSGDKSQNSQGNNDYWIVKSDKNGKKVWEKSYGGTQEDYLNRVIQTADGGYLLGGSSRSGKSGDKTEAGQGERDYWVVKIDKQGTKQWDKTFGGSGNDELKKVVQLTSGEYVVGGTSNSPVSGDKSQASQGNHDYWLVKISADGNKVWDKRYGGRLDETLGSFTETRDGGFFLGGSSASGSSGDKSQASQGKSDFWAVKTDKDGNLLWEKSYGGSDQDEAYSVGRSQGDNLFIAGTSSSGKEGDKSQKSKGEKDYWLIRLDEKGTKLWDKTFGGNQDDELRASTYTEEGNYILAGTSSSSNSGDKTQANQGASDYWVVEVAPGGEKIADQRFGGNGSEELHAVLQTYDGGLLLGGRSDSGVSGDRTQPSQGSTDYWLVKVAPQTSAVTPAREATLVDEPAEIINLSAYPNPFREKITVSFTLPQSQSVQLKIYDNQGKEITTLFQGQTQVNQTYQVHWQAGPNPAGLYFLQLQTPTQRHQQKMLLTK
ncbi:hypothetical protein AHMF7605_17430 [Adhaeribacter arboris]|uniref:Secretion system C-terminal sorting domain-containing protein n=1 Tax=Adhaeribacter arboris TaxID=2072846 RepID=A0A2T2YI35_9BACT|nr:T9SS type A sorting domain-containing protein [Adhaeribacter arboris]PSR55161.1 hypothetical protein AHMF7605_17430 [Adhaeribacter arboris]